MTAKKKANNIHINRLGLKLTLNSKWTAATSAKSNSTFDGSKGEWRGRKKKKGRKAGSVGCMRAEL